MGRDLGNPSASEPSSHRRAFCLGGFVNVRVGETGGPALRVSLTGPMGGTKGEPVGQGPFGHFCRYDCDISGRKYDRSSFGCKQRHFSVGLSSLGI